jgi:hypothetical protein
MRAFFISLGLLTACATQPPQRPIASQVSTCYVATSPVPIQWGDSTNAAMQDFARHSDAAYSLLYIERTSGHPDRDYDVCVTQQADGQWHLVRYKGVHVRTRILPRSAFANCLLLPPAHYLPPACRGFSSLSISGILCVKQGSATTFSMGLDLVQWEWLTASEQQLLQPGFDLIQQLKQYQ